MGQYSHYYPCENVFKCFLNNEASAERKLRDFVLKTKTATLKSYLLDLFYSDCLKSHEFLHRRTDFFFLHPFLPMETHSRTMWTGGIINKKMFRRTRLLFQYRLMTLLMNVILWTKRNEKGTLINSTVMSKWKTKQTDVWLPVDSNHEDIFGFLSRANTTAAESSENECITSFSTFFYITFCTSKNWCFLYTSTETIHRSYKHTVWQFHTFVSNCSSALNVIFLMN